jgi:hypothetical protein
MRNFRFIAIFILGFVYNDFGYEKLKPVNFSFNVHHSFEKITHPASKSPPAAAAIEQDVCLETWKPHQWEVPGQRRQEMASSMAHLLLPMLADLSLVRSLAALAQACRNSLGC